MGRSEGKALPWGAWNSGFLLKVGLNCGLYFGKSIFSALLYGLDVLKGLKLKINRFGLKES
ncbi:MAG: hypothetical protein QXS54_05170 [Candidatus Methanomethylicaceae archaeon]